MEYYIDLLATLEDYQLELKARKKLAEYEGEVRKGAAMPAEEAFKWYESCAKKGSAYAHFAVATCYENGYGIKRNYKKACQFYNMVNTRVMWIRNEILDYLYPKRNERISEALNMMYENEEAYEQAYERQEKEQFEQCKALAETGDDVAQQELSRMYYTGTGTRRDEDTAFYWCQKAAEQGNAKALGSLGWHYKQRCGVKGNTAKAIEFFRKAAEAGDRFSQECLGDIYYNGIGDNVVGEHIKRNYEEAAKWYRKIAERALEKLHGRYIYRGFI